ncbi:MAG: hypothetical protein K9N51_10905 [Candidatus Pacebacteria bacterium]|nr:hypothetical protein [Candidatus Paceibacterota bacterium]
MMKHGLVIAGLATWSLLVGTGIAHAQQPRWLETGEWEGRGTRYTSVFHVNTDRWRIRLTNLSADGVQVTVFDENGNQKAASRMLRIPLYVYEHMEGSGRYYLKIQGEGGRWKVAVHQYLSKIQEWELLQEMRHPDTPLTKFATWTGSSGSEEMVFSPAAPRWKMKTTLTGKGQCTLRLVDRKTEDVPVLETTLDRPGTYDTWVHQDGSFELTVESQDMEWKVDGLSREKPHRQ